MADEADKSEGKDLVKMVGPGVVQIGDRTFVLSPLDPAQGGTAVAIPGGTMGYPPGYYPPGMPMQPVIVTTQAPATQQGDPRIIVVPAADKKPEKKAKTPQPFKTA